MFLSVRVLSNEYLIRVWHQEGVILLAKEVILKLLLY